MKTSIKTTIGIITIALGSISFAQAGEHRGERNYEKPRQERHFNKNKHHEYSKYSHNRHDRIREQRHFRKHKKSHRIANRHFKARKRALRHNRWEHSYRTDYNRGYYGRDLGRRYNNGYRHTEYITPRYVTPRYVAPRHVAPRYSSHVSVSGHGVPVLAGTLIGSAIANDVSHGDPVATFGGAVIGAIIGNQIRHH